MAVEDSRLTAMVALAEQNASLNERRLCMARKRKSYQRGSVRLHNGKWTLRYREEGTIKRVMLGEFKSEKQARREADRIMATVNVTNGKPLQMTFKQFVEGRWQAYTLKKNYQPSTLDLYGSLNRIHLLTFFEDKLLTEIAPTDVSDFLDRLQPKVSTNTLQAIYSLLRLMFDLAFQLDLIEASPVRPKLHRPETARVDKPTLTADQINQIVDKLPRSERLLAVLISITGLR